jgi:hypothetical protein
MKRAALLLTMLAGLVAVPAASSQASWVGDHCYVRNFPVNGYSRSDARVYADIARNEGYEWGGGCWNNNNVDDTPGQPDSSGEGPDCSGFVFKTWFLANGFGATGQWYWDNIQNIHGPYSSTSFHDVSTTWYPFFRLADKSRNTTLSMDAFAKQGHIGMLYTTVNPSSGTDWIIEAKGDAYGTNLFEETYRFDSAYVAVRRRGWAQ